MKTLMKQGRFPAGWDETRVRRVPAHYDEQTEEEAWQKMRRRLSTTVKRSWMSRKI
jgi:hypothetical protein